MVIHNPSRDMQRDKDICKLWAFDGLTMVDIGKKYGIGKERVRQILKRNGYTGAQRKVIWYQDICDDFTDGLSTREISNRYHITIETVRDILKRFDVWKDR